MGLQERITGIFRPGPAYRPPTRDPAEERRLTESLLENLVELRAMFGASMDLVVHEVKVCGIPCAVALCEGMVDTNVWSKMFAQPLVALALEGPTPQKLLAWLRTGSLLAPDQKEVRTFGELFRFMMSGFVVLLVDGVDLAEVFGIQGFAGRSVEEPAGESNMRGSREGFVERLRPNFSLVRRRLKTPDLIFEMVTLGTKSRTDGALVYLKDTVSPELLRQIRQRLARVQMDVVLETGYLQPFLERRPLSLFSGVGVTERPDTLCAKVAEGRVGLLLDGTPYALVMPYLFGENFQSLDDYSHRPYFSTLIRWLKYGSFLLTVLLPGLYVAVGSFHPELLPPTLLMDLVVSQETTPFPLALEALFTFFIYEIVREAGLRMPRSVGHAVSIVGGLVIGDAAVSAGLIGAPMVIVVAITAISAFVAPALYEPVTVLRFAFLLTGGLLGVFGVTLGFCAVVVNLCAVNPFGVPAASPAAPLSPYALRDVGVRWGWRLLSRQDLRVQDLAGSDLRSEGGTADGN